jgi:hypothetical protein
MTIYTMSRKPAALPVAPKAIAPELLQSLLRDSSLLHGYAVTLPSRCRELQRAILRGSWYSTGDLKRTQRICRTVLMAARTHRDLQPETLAALDLLTAFVSAIEIPTNASEAA